MKNRAGLNDLDRKADNQGFAATVLAILIALVIGAALFGG